MKNPEANLTETSDDELIRRSCGRDRDAFGQLVARYQNLVVSIAYSISGDFGRSEEVAQEAFVAAWQNLASLKEHEKFRSWLSGIVRNLSNDSVRKQIRRGDAVAESETEMDEAVSPSATPDVQAISREETELVWRTLADLPPMYREPLILFYREAHSVERVAMALDLSEDTVKQRLSRGRGLLRERVESMIDRTLGATTPTVLFTLSVVGSLPVLAVQATSVGAVSTLAKVGFGKALLSFSWLAAVLAPFLSHYQGRRQMRYASTPADRHFLHRINWLATTFLTICGLFAVSIFWSSRDPFALKNSMPWRGFITGVSLVVFTLMMIVLAWLSPRLREVYRRMRLPVGSAPRRLPLTFARSWGYQSRMRLWGLPLIDVRFGKSKETPMARGLARGWIALGDEAYGVLFAMGGVAFGGIAVGGIACGAIALGGVALGVVTFGFVGFGVLTNGFIVVGDFALGSAFALGKTVATGFIAISQNITEGTRFAVGIRDFSHHWRESHALLRTLKPIVEDGILRGALLGLSFSLPTALFQNYFVRYQDSEVNGISTFGTLREHRTMAPKIITGIVMIVALGAGIVSARERTLGKRQAAALIQARADVDHARPDSPDYAEARFHLANLLIAPPSESYASALTEVLWCFDEGRTHQPAFAQNNGRDLFETLEELNRVYPPTQAALQLRRDNIARRITQGAFSAATITDLINLNRILGESAANLSLYDQLPTDHPARAMLGGRLFTNFLQAKRYRDAAAAEPLTSILRRLGSTEKIEGQESTSVRPFFHESNLRWLTDRLEALAGAKHREDTQELLQRLLKYDNSPKAVERFKAALTRAGHSDYFDAVASFDVH